MSNDMSKKLAFSAMADGISPSDLKTLFDRAKVKCVLNKDKVIPINALLDALYELKVNEKSERNYVRFFSEYGMSQLAINKATGIGLRKIKLYLTENATKKAK